MIIRNICEGDAEQFLNLCNKLDAETQFMMLEPGERSTTTEEQRTQIEHEQGSSKEAWLGISLDLRPNYNFYSF